MGLVDKLTKKNRKGWKVGKYCDDCCMRFKTQYDFIKHRQKHGDHWECIDCGFQYKGPSQIDLHIQRKHKDSYP